MRKKINVSRWVVWNIQALAFAKGYSPKDIKVKIGDFIFADNDAVIIIPREIMPIIKDNIIKAVKEESEIKDKIREVPSISEILKEHKSF